MGPIYVCVRFQKIAQLADHAPVLLFEHQHNCAINALRVIITWFRLKTSLKYTHGHIFPAVIYYNNLSSATDRLEVI